MEMALLRRELKLIRANFGRGGIIRSGIGERVGRGADELQN
jgi:hypothetical protein